MSQKVIKRVKGFAGQLELLKNKIRIKREGLTAFLFFGSNRKPREIYLNKISSIEFERAGVTHGHIRFIAEGEKRPPLMPGELLWDENTIFFNVLQQSAFEDIKNRIERRIAKSGAKGKGKEDLKEFHKLVELRDKGVISKKEFEKERKKLLGF